MKREIFLASNNEGKAERYRRLLGATDLDIVLRTPKDFGLEHIEVEENGKTLAENALIKARAYFGKVPLAILSNDTGFWVEGEGLAVAPKRITLNGRDEHELSKKEIAQSMVEFWKGIATKHGGRVEAAWLEAFALLDPDGTVHTTDAKREVILTDQVFGEPHIEMPVRALYISKVTNKKAVEHSEEEERREMKPVIDALSKILTS